MPNPPEGYTRVCPYLLYEDAQAAVDHLTNAFGFVQRRVETGAAGRMHTELVLDEDGLVMLGQAGEAFQSPKRLGAQPSSLVHVYVDDVSALHERAKSSGAEVSELEDAPNGERRFSSTDPEGQVWFFSQSGS